LKTVRREVGHTEGDSLIPQRDQKQWLMSVILVTQEAEVGGLWFEANPGKN
jgi:hypothetical protein